MTNNQKIGTLVSVVAIIFSSVTGIAIFAPGEVALIASVFTLIFGLAVVMAVVVFLI